MTVECVIWWLEQPSHEMAMALGAENAAWPDYIKAQFQSRGGRAGRGCLWVADEIDFRGITWKDGDPSFQAVGKDCGGIVIRRSDAHHVLSWPGFVTDEHLNPIVVLGR